MVRVRLNVIRCCLAICAVLATVVATGQSKRVELQFEGDGKRHVWLGPSVLSGPMDDPIPFTGATYEAELGLAKPDDRIYVADGSGNLAIRQVKDLQRSWKLTSADFTHLEKVRVTVKRDGKPVAAAIVEVTAGDRREVVLLTPESQGTVEAWAIPFGRIGVQVAYAPRTPGANKNKKTPKQEFELARDRDDPVPTLAINIDDDVETLGDAAASASEGAEPPTAAPQNESSGNDFSGVLKNLVATLITLGVAGTLGYFAFQYVRRNPDQVKERLAKVGVSIPEPNALPADDPSIPAPSFSKPETLMPIVLDSTPAAPTSPSGAPRLVRTDGVAFELSPDGNTVGRDGACTIAWADQSSVSRRHAEIVLDHGAWMIQDLGSTNGTFVNGVRIDAPTPLRPGDTLILGQVTARFEA